jgi:hypothetical protein
MLKKFHQVIFSRLAGYENQSLPEASFIILDGSALINALPSRISKTFEEYAVLEIVPKVQGYSCTYMRRYCV